MKRKPVRVLFILGSMEIGGVQSGIMNFAKITPKEDALFDVVVHSKQIGFHESEFAQYGKIYHISLMESRSKIGGLLCLLFNNIILKMRLVRFLNQHPGYDVVHSKSLEYSAAIMEAAKNTDIPVRVSQCHVDKPDHLNPFHRWYYRWCAGRIEKNATVKLAVSPSASELMFGKLGGRVIKNPTISLKRLNPNIYHPQPHDWVQFIQIGTFSHRKNQIFSVRVIKRLRDKGEDARLLFIGFPLDEPDYIKKIKEIVRQERVSEFITFLPKDADVPKELSETDYMLIPSVREGLPNVALEAQAMGVPCFISDTVNPETDCGLCTFLPLADSPEKWAEEIISYRKENGTVKKYIDMSEWDNVKVCQEYVKIWRGE